MGRRHSRMGLDVGFEFPIVHIFEKILYFFHFALLAWSSVLIYVR
jgi:hypothetical protein